MKTKMRSYKIAVAVAIVFVVILAARVAQQQTAWPTALPPGPFNGIDDVQYFPASPDNKLANETARLRAARKLKAVQATKLTDEQ